MVLYIEQVLLVCPLGSPERPIEPYFWVDLFSSFYLNHVSNLNIYLIYKIVGLNLSDLLVNPISMSTHRDICGLDDYCSCMFLEY